MNDEFPSVRASEQKRKREIYAQGLLRATPCREGSACGVSADTDHLLFGRLFSLVEVVNA